jgi:hypothetical protein
MHAEILHLLVELCTAQVCIREYSCRREKVNVYLNCRCKLFLLKESTCIKDTIFFFLYIKLQFPVIFINNCKIITINNMIYKCLSLYVFKFF